ncbi:PREDICTED: transmembrane 4 L6 family member 1-like [Crocodylus porosus]|uniref:transmembrane 4 L6 family member 1-like n=1 Tax=Crocodylus porosus TaxID=8502 RepID=UPI000938D0E6|nr:PREDICTED: transmembrane 4 L6 family member 1-like [Crocodylus porosus]XP_019385878.1 PREDICTED: transmembrane 4 L6 family member 1-like [Crocodylus porosus]
MCTGKCSKCIGVMLLPLAICAIISNLLLYFPNGQVLESNEITDLVWFFHGILGAGILVILPAFMMLGASGGCCANRCGMLLSVFLAVLGVAGGAYCVTISSMGLIDGPLCDTGDGQYMYPFRNNTLTYNYLFNQTTWSICKKPENVVIWNIVLFSLLLGFGTVEAVLCLIQVINGFIGFICGTCIKRRKIDIVGM